MSSIERYGATSLTRSVSRQVSRGISRIEANTAIQAAQVEAAAEVQTAKVDAATAVTQRALQATAYATNIEMQLAEACPAAMSRLKMVGDTGAMALQQITFDTVTRLRRI